MLINSCHKVISLSLHRGLTFTSSILDEYSNFEAILNKVLNAYLIRFNYSKEFQIFDFKRFKNYAAFENEFGFKPQATFKGFLETDLLTTEQLFGFLPRILEGVFSIDYKGEELTLPDLIKIVDERLDSLTKDSSKQVILNHFDTIILSLISSNYDSLINLIYLKFKDILGKFVIRNAPNDNGIDNRQFKTSEYDFDTFVITKEHMDKHHLLRLLCVALMKKSWVSKSGQTFDHNRRPYKADYVFCFQKSAEKISGISFISFELPTRKSRCLTIGSLYRDELDHHFKPPPKVGPLLISLMLQYSSSNKRLDDWDGEINFQTAHPQTIELASYWIKKSNNAVRVLDSHSAFIEWFEHIDSEKKIDSYFKSIINGYDCPNILSMLDFVDSNSSFLYSPNVSDTSPLLHPSSRQRFKQALFIFYVLGFSYADYIKALNNPSFFAEVLDERRLDAEAYISKMYKLLKRFDSTFHITFTDNLDHNLTILVRLSLGMFNNNRLPESESDHRFGSFSSKSYRKVMIAFFMNLRRRGSAVAVWGKVDPEVVLRLALQQLSYYEGTDYQKKQMEFLFYGLKGLKYIKTSAKSISSSLVSSCDCFSPRSNPYSDYPGVSKIENVLALTTAQLVKTVQETQALYAR